MAAEHCGDAAFRSALAAQLAYDDARAECLYRSILELGLDWSPVWNNLAVIAVHRHQYSEARKLLAQGVAANERDVVVLTNYGVISYHLSDFAEARRTLAEARALRRRLINSIPSERSGQDDLRYARATEALDQTAQKYLTRIDLATLTDAPAPPADLVADLTVNRF
jgi:tetratricopeptide (TPR) repeat protein